MGCMHNNFEGICNMYDEDSDFNNPPGCDIDGYCTCDEDTYPEDTCGSYESDDVCRGCGADFNAGEDCTCTD